jgi:hypothetical protein
MPLHEYWWGKQGSPFQSSGGFWRLSFTFSKPITVTRNTVPLKNKNKNHVIDNVQYEMYRTMFKQVVL